MAGKTISSSQSATYDMSPSSNPLSITAAGTIMAGNSAYGVYGSGFQPWTVTNSGSVSAMTAGILFEDGGTVTNSGMIVSTGTFSGGAIDISRAAGTVTNTGTLMGGNDGVVLRAGGSVVNGSTSGAAGYIRGAGNDGVYIGGGAGTITDVAGTISGKVDAIQFVGSYADKLILDPGATLVGAVVGGSGTNTLELAAGAGSGTVSSVFTNFTNVNVDSNAIWTLASGNTIGAGATIVDSGMLTNQGKIGSTVTVAAGSTSSFANQGVISGGTFGVKLRPGSVLSNSGIITDTNQAAVYGTGVTTVINTGTITGAARGIELVGVGYVDNSGVVTASSRSAVYIHGGLGTVTNTGSISGASFGVDLANGGSVTNTGTILGAGPTALYFNTGGTVTDSGTIQGGTYAVKFGGSTAGRVILDPGAVLVGSIAGSGTARATNTLELAGTSGQTGTLSTFDTQFTNFGTVTVDKGATWVFASSETFGSGVTLSNAGSIASTVTLGAGASPLTNTGSISGYDGVDLLAGGMIINSGTTSSIIGISNRGISVGGAAGTISNAGIIYGVKNGVVLLAGGTVANTGTGALIKGAIYSGVYANGAAGTVSNYGIIYGRSNGIQLKSGGSITNTGSIAGGITYGVQVTGTTGYVSNSGTIYGLRGGVVLDAGGSVTNTGTIQGAGPTALDFDNGGTVTDAGTIQGGTYAVRFGGSYADRVILDPGAVLVGSIAGSGTTGATNTLELAGTSGQTGTLSNFASFTNFGTVTVDSGATWVFSSGETFGSGVTVSNAGSIASTVTLGAGAGPLTNSGSISGSDGVDLLGGGTVVNSGTASSIMGTSNRGISVGGAAGTVVNAGTISGQLNGVVLSAGGTVANTSTSARIMGTDYSGVYVNGAAGTVSNSGTIYGFLNGIQLKSGGSVTNTGSAGSITGLVGPAIYVSGNTGMVTNAATIEGARGIELAAGGSVDNTGIVMSTYKSGIFIHGTGAAGTVTNAGLISGHSFGVDLTNGGSVLNTGTIKGAGPTALYFNNGGTVTEAGTIQGGTYAIRFGGSAAGRVILDIGAVLTGKVAGSGTAGASTTLELAAGTAGQVGTLSTLYTQFTNIGTVQVDAGATWAFTPSETFGAGTTLVNLGSIANEVTLTAGGSLVNSGSIVQAAASYAVYATGAAAVTNTGTLLGKADGIYLQAGGTVTNSAGAITGRTKYGLDIENGYGVVGNAGTITGLQDGVRLGGGGTLVDTGAITGKTAYGVQVFGGAGTVTVAGAISGGKAAIEFLGNYSDRLILDPGAVLNGGAIGGLGSNTLELAAGTGALSNLATFTNFGTVQADAGASWTLGGNATIASQLLSDGAGTLALTGVIGGAGSLVQSGSGVTRLAGVDTFSGGALIQAGTLDVAAGAKAGSGAITFSGTGGLLQVDGTAMPTNIISGFQSGDTINLSAVAYDASGTATLGTNDVLDVHENGHDYDLQLDPSQSYAGDTFILSDPTGTDVTVQQTTPCYVTGTRIRVARGDAMAEVAVEHLEVGDLAVTASGAQRPIRWLGHRTLDPRRHPRPHEAQPIRIAAHALAPNHPARDLLVSPGHSICIDVVGEVLIPAFALANGSTIQQVDVDAVTYWHVELDSHDILLAENLACESYLDMSNRGFFQKADVVDIAAGPDAPVRTHADFCRPFHMKGRLVEVVRAQSSARARALGWQLEERDLDDLHLLVDGVRVAPRLRGFVARFAIPADARDVWLVAPTSIPAAVGDGPDLRSLGACLTCLDIDDGFDACQTIALDDPRLCVGFHAVERDGEATWRWTAGRARLPANLWADARDGDLQHDIVLRVRLAGPMLPRWVAPMAARGDTVLAVAS